VDEFEPSLAAFRFYEDGTESGASAAAAQDTNVTRENSSNNQVQLRVRIDETGAGDIDGATTDDYQLQYRLNGGGSWFNITGATSRVQADSGSTLSDGSASTNRSTDGISDGAGTFVAGEQEAGDGEIEDHQLTGNDFTEHVFGLLLIAADNSDGDYMEYRLRYNGGVMPNNVVPRTTIEKVSILDAVGSITGIATLAGLATGTFIAKGSISGIGALDGDAGRIRDAVAPIDASGALAAAAARIRDAVGAMDGVGSLQGIATGTFQAVGQIAGIGSLDADAARIRGAIATIDGVGTLDAAAGRIRVAIAAIDGAGFLQGAADVFSLILASAAMSGSGSLQADAGRLLDAAAQMAGVGSLQGVGTGTFVAAAQIDGAGTLAADANMIMSAVAQILGAGSLAANPNKQGGAPPPPIEAVAVMRGVLGVRTNTRVINPAAPWPREDWAEHLGALIVRG
jgi:hypothetical protein